MANEPSDKHDSELIRLLHQRYQDMGDMLARKAAWRLEELTPSAVAVDSPQTWVAAEKAKLDAYEDAARSVEKLAEDYTHEHGSYDGSTNAWELHHRHAEYIEALDAAVEAIRKRKAEKCHITKAKAL